MNPSPDVADHVARILIVDDEPHNRKLLEVMLLPEGFVLAAAGSGEEALKMVSVQPPDLILLDIMMPGMNGYQVAAAIKGDRATKNIPIIMITALDDRDAKMQGLSAGAEDFLSKPVDRAELCVRVRNLLRLKRYGDYHDKYSQLLEGEVGLRTADLMESERLYRSTFDAAPVGIVHVGLDGAWLRVNQRICDLLGYSREELQGPGGRDLTQSEDSAEEVYSLRAMLEGAVDRHVIDEKLYRRRDGGVLWGRLNISVHRNAKSQLQYFIAVIEDITERRTLEAQFRQANKMDAIGQLASGVAHDFNNLLTVILGFGEMMQLDDALSDENREDVDEIVKAANRAAGLTKQLLAFSRQQLLNTEPVDVNVLIKDMAGMLSRLIGENIEVALKLALTIPPVLADKGQLEQVVMNLAVNARDAMPNGGHLTIETSEVELENSTFHDETVMSGRYVRIGVSDTGNGMSKETMRRLFEPFFTTKALGSGTGLGLSTSYGIVKQSKGYIWVYSELGHGTTFNVYLPPSSWDDSPAAASVATQATHATPTPFETILLVEDESGVRKLVRRMLEDVGYRVLEAANGDEAEVTFLSNSSSIDLVVTDLIMPGCGGPELLKRLHEVAPTLRVLYISGYSVESAGMQAKFNGGLPLVLKPFTAAELAKQVRIALDR